MKISLIAPCLIAASSAASAVTLLPLQHIQTNRAADHVVFNIEADTINSPIAHLLPGTTNLTPAATYHYLLKGSGDPFDPNSGRSAVLAVPISPWHPWDMPFTAVALIAETLADTAPGVTLYVGKYTDQKPRLDDPVLCRAQVTSTSQAQCVIGQDGLYAVNLWVMAVAPDDAGAQFVANVSTGMVGEFPSAHHGPPITGPEHLDAGQAFSLRMNLSAQDCGTQFQSVQRCYGAAIITNREDFYDYHANVAVLPYSEEYRAGGDESSYPVLFGPAMITGQGFDWPPSGLIALQPGESMRRLFFDLPPSVSPYDSLAIDMVATGENASPSVEFSLVRAEFPSASSDAVVAEAPAVSNPAATWLANQQGQVARGVLSHPSAGRWYLVAKNVGSKPASFSIDGIRDITNADNAINGFGYGATPTIAPGQYFNPQRSGHGISIGRGSDQQVLYWYSYTEDGAPVWYLAQAHAPAADSGWWVAPLSLATWDGQTVQLGTVGAVELVPTAPNKFMFSWQLEGRGGSEAFELVAPNDACPTLDGSKTNLSANWYPPAQPGYGIDVLALSDHQAEVFYLYDSQGQARWVYGVASAAASNASASLDQFSGFCPACAYPGGIIPTHVGTLNLHFADWLSGHMQASITLQPPLSGSWNIDQPMARLTGLTAPCSP